VTPLASDAGHHLDAGEGEAWPVLDGEFVAGVRPAGPVLPAD